MTRARRNGLRRENPALRRVITLCAVSAAGLSLGACATPLSIAGYVSTAVTGKDLGEHAVSIALGKDCRFVEGMMREDRDICEELGSAATAADFKGVFELARDEAGEAFDPAPARLAADSADEFAAPFVQPAAMGGGREWATVALDRENTAFAEWSHNHVAREAENTRRVLARREDNDAPVSVAEAPANVTLATLRAPGLVAEIPARIEPVLIGVADAAGEALDAVAATAAGAPRILSVTFGFSAAAPVPADESRSGEIMVLSLSGLH